jgi:hypothetical protein
LKHENMGMIVFMADQNALARPPHAIAIIMFFKSLEPGCHRRVLFWLCFLGSKRVVGERIEPDRLRLVGSERGRDDGPSVC